MLALAKFIDNTVITVTGVIILRCSSGVDGCTYSVGASEAIARMTGVVSDCRVDDYCHCINGWSTAAAAAAADRNSNKT